MRSWFYGPHGVRAGWRIALAYVLYRIIVLVFAPLQHKVVATLGPDLTAEGLLKVKSVQLATIGLTTAMLALIEHRQPADYGLPFNRRLTMRLAAGATAGWLALTLVLTVLLISGAFHPGAPVLPLHAALTNALGWAAAYGVVAAQEELLFRGYLQHTLTRGVGFWPAAVITSFAFLLAHQSNAGETAPGLLGVFMLGLLFCGLLWATGSLWLPIGFHAGWDFAESFLYSAPNSGMYISGHLLSSVLAGPAWLTGGAAGPEGSIVCIVLAGVATIALAARRRATARCRPQPRR